MTFMMSGMDGSGAVHAVLPWEAFGGHVPPGGSEMYWLDQSHPIHLLKTVACLPGVVVGIFDGARGFCEGCGGFVCALAVGALQGANMSIYTSFLLSGLELSDTKGDEP